MYRVLEATCVHAAGLTALNLQVRVDALELWMTLMVMNNGGTIVLLMLAKRIKPVVEKRLYRQTVKKFFFTIKSFFQLWVYVVSFYGTTSFQLRMKDFIVKLLKDFFFDNKVFFQLRVGFILYSN